jgi:hypothetical protein
MVVGVGRIWNLKRDFKSISRRDFKIISQRDILNNIPTWRYYQYKLSEISKLEERYLKFALLLWLKSLKNISLNIHVREEWNSCV